MGQPLCSKVCGEKKMSQVKKKMSNILIPILMLTVICLFSSSNPISGIQSPIHQNIIIQYGDSAEERKAISIIQEQTGATILSADSLLLYLKIQRSKGMIFVVGHGTEEGILHKEDVKIWREIARDLRLSSKKVILVSCNSEKAAQEYNYLGGFPEDIDAVVAAYIASAAYFMNTKQQGKAQENIERARQRFQAIFHNPSLTNSLGLSIEELAGFMFFFILDIFSLIPAISAISFFKKKLSGTLKSNKAVNKQFTSQISHGSVFNILGLFEYFVFFYIEVRDNFLEYVSDLNLSIDDGNLTIEKAKELVNDIKEDLNDEGNMTDSNDTDSNDTDSNDTDSNDTDSNDTDSNDTDSNDTDSETTDFWLWKWAKWIGLGIYEGLKILNSWDKLLVLASLGLDVLEIIVPIGLVKKAINVLNGVLALMSIASSILSLIWDADDKDDVYGFSVEENNGTKAGEDYGLDFAFKKGYNENFTEKINASGIVDYYDFNSQFIEGLKPRPAEDCGDGEYCDLFRSGFNSTKSDEARILNGSFWGDRHSALYLDGYRRGQDSGVFHGKAKIIKAGYYTGFFADFKHVLYTPIGSDDSISLDNGSSFSFYSNDTYDDYFYVAFYNGSWIDFANQPGYASNDSEAYRLGFEHGYRHGFNTTFLRNNTYYDLSVAIGKHSYDLVPPNSSSSENDHPVFLGDPDNPSLSPNSLETLPDDNAFFTNDYSPFAFSNPTYLSNFLDGYFRALNHSSPAKDLAYNRGYDKGYTEGLPSDLGVTGVTIKNETDYFSYFHTELSVIGADTLPEKADVLYESAVSGMLDGHEYFFYGGYKQQYIQAYEQGHAAGNYDGQHSLPHKQYRAFFNAGRTEGNLEGAPAGNTTGFWNGYYLAHLDLDVDFPSYFGTALKSEGYAGGYDPDPPDFEEHYSNLEGTPHFYLHKQLMITSYKLGYVEGYNSSFSSSYDSGNESGFKVEMLEVTSTTAGKLGVTHGSTNGRLAAYQKSYLLGFLGKYKDDYYSSSSISVESITSYFSLDGVGLELFPLEVSFAPYNLNTLSKLGFAAGYVSAYSSVYTSSVYHSSSFAIGEAGYDLLNSSTRSSIRSKYRKTALSSIFQASSVNKKVTALFDYSPLVRQDSSYVFAFLQAYLDGVGSLSSLSLDNIAGYEVGYVQGYFDYSPAAWGLSALIFDNTTKYYNNYQSLYNTFYDANYSQSSSSSPLLSSLSSLTIDIEDMYLSNFAASGYADGYDFGFADKYAGLYSEAYAEGYNLGKSASSWGFQHRDYGHAYVAGRTEGYSEGYTAGRKVGYKRGYYEGYESTDAPSGGVSTPLSFDAGYSEYFDPDPVAPEYSNSQLLQGSSSFDAFKLADRELHIANHNLGYKNMYFIRYKSGYNSRFSAGRIDGTNYGESIEITMTSAYNQGYALGRSKGHSAGRTEGYADGYYEAGGTGYVSRGPSYSSSKRSGYSYTSPSIYDSYADATYLRNHKAAYDRGYNSGFSAGYNEGYDAGKRSGKAYAASTSSYSSGSGSSGGAGSFF